MYKKSYFFIIINKKKEIDMIKLGVGVKNFFVRRERVKFKDKGLFNLLKYLEDDKHKNHSSKTEEITQIFNSRDKFYLNTINRVKKREFDTKMNRKRGRELGSYRFSYCFSFPKGLKVSKEENEKIIRILLKDFRKTLKIKPDELLQNSFINLHKNQNEHINLVVNKVINNEVIDLSKKKYLIVLKKSFDYRCLNVLNLDKNNYKPQQPPRRIKIKQNVLYNLTEVLKNEIKEEYEIKKIETDKLIKRFFTYLNRYETHNKNKSIKEREKIKILINNTINKIEIKEIKEEMIKELPYQYPSIR